MALLLPALLYLAAAVFLLGMGGRWLKWLRAPVPLRIVLTPAPKTSLGVIRRLAEEMLGFRSLFEADRLFWIPAWLFHISLLLLLLGHIGGLVLPGFARAALGLTENQFESLARIVGGAVGILALGSLLALLFRRLTAERTRWISTFSDYFVLALLLFIVATGNQMRATSGFDLPASRRFVSGWLTGHPIAPPANPFFAAHVILICALLIYIPFSKLVHIGGATLFSPTLNQRNNPRERRHRPASDAPPAPSRAHVHEGSAT